MRCYRFVLSLAALFLASGTIQAQPTPPTVRVANRPIPPPGPAEHLVQAKPVADAALGTFKRMVTPQNFGRMGFALVGDVQRATLGEPMFDFLVRLDELARYQPGTNPNSLVKRTNELKYPVLVDGAVRSLISVALVNNVWKATSYGAPRLARFIDAARAAKMAELGRAASTFFVVRVPALKVILLGHTDGGALFLTPIIEDARVGFQAGGTLAAADAFSRLLPLATTHDGSPG